MIGTTVGHFRIIAKLADSGSGEVYRAEDEALRRLVALEVLSPALASNPERKARFLNAARAAAAVTHPNLAAIHEVGESDGRVWVAMELVDGASLRSRMHGGRRLPLLETLRIGEQVAKALGAAHDTGLAHGDLRSEKVLLGPGGQVKVVDLGLGGGNPGPLDDIHRLGALLYAMATGATPRPADPAGAGKGAATIPPSTLNPETPAELDRIVGACLEPDPADRYQNAGEIATDLGRLRHSIETAPVVAPGGKVRARHGETWSVPRIALSAAAALFLVTALGFGMWQWVWPSLKPEAPFKPGDRILVADFVNETDDVELGVALREVVEGLMDWISLDLSPVFRDTATETATLDGDAAAARCLRGDCEGYITGRVSGDGTRYRLEIALHRAGRGRPVVEASSVVSDGKVGHAFDWAMKEMGRDLQRIGIAGPSPTSQCMIWSGDANGVKAFQALLKAYFNRRSDPAEQAQAFRRALDLDPSAPVHYYNLGFQYTTLGRSREAVPLFKEAWQRGQVAAAEIPQCREHALFWEKTYLEWTWGYDTQMERLNRAVQIFPENADFHCSLGITTNRLLDDRLQALTHFRKAYELDSNYFSFLANTLLQLGKVDEVDALIADLRRSKWFAPGNHEPQIADAQVGQAYVRGDDYIDIVAMIDAIVAMGRVRAEALRPIRGMTLAAAGRLDEAEKVLREAAHGRDTTAARSGVGAVRGYDTLDWLETRRTGTVRMLTPVEVDGYLAHYVAVVRLAQISVDLRTTRPLAEVLRTAEQDHGDIWNQRVLDGFRYAHGCLSLLEGRSREAVTLLEPLAREYGPRSIVPPQHALGRAYETVGRWSDAARMYEAVLAQPRLASLDSVTPRPVFVLEQHRLAAIYERVGNAERARYWYARFLDDWKNADPGTPEVEDAKRRLATLGGQLPAES